MAKISPKAKKLHKDAIVIDGHNDHVICKDLRGDRLDLMKVNRSYHSDGARLLAGGVTASMFMVDGHFLGRSLKYIEQVHQEIERNSDKLMLVTKTRHIRQAKRTGKLGIIMSWESCRAVKNDLELLQAAYRLGVRCSTVTHNEGGFGYTLQGSPSPYCYCTQQDRETFRKTFRGLTDFGKQAVREMNRLGILVDVAHANDKTFFDMIDLAERPMISSHGSAFALCPQSRASTDDQIRALAATGGLLAVVFYWKFIDLSQRKATVGRLVDHIAYVAELVGIDHVGLGSDFDGLMPGEWPILRSADQLPQITEEMVRRGFSESEIRKVLGKNFLRVLAATMG